MKASSRIFIFSFIALLLSGILGQHSVALSACHSTDLYGNNIHAAGVDLPIQQIGFKSTQLPYKLKIAIRTKALQSDSTWFMASELSFCYPIATALSDHVYGRLRYVPEYDGEYAIHRLRGPPSLLIA